MMGFLGDRRFVHGTVIWNLLIQPALGCGCCSRRKEREPGAFRAGVGLEREGVEAPFEEGGSDASGRSFSTR